MDSVMSKVYVALDLETTGLDPERDAIIEIGAVRFRGEQVFETFSTFINPGGRPIPQRVKQLTGISDADVANAPSLRDVRQALVRFVGTNALVGHNVGFDLAFLRRHGLFTRQDSLDTFELSGILLPHAARYSLERLAQELEIEASMHHRALADAETSRSLFLALEERARQLPAALLDELLQASQGVDWPAREVLLEAKQEQARYAFVGGIGQQLMEKGLLNAEGMANQLFYGAAEDDEQPPLDPSPTVQPVDVEAMARLLGPDGLFAQAFPGYEHRAEQVAMLRRVGRALNEGEHLLVEAGTGTGKSVAYLLPAMHFALTNRERVVISTNTINLQDQLYSKDIPDLQRLLGLEVRSVLLKGRSHYLCLRKLAAFRRKRAWAVEELRLLAKVLVWLPTTVTGDRAELFLPTPQEGALWARIASDGESCAGDRCPYARDGRCFFRRARRKAEQAHLIVVNHALLLSDVAVENRVLPEYRHVIIDEAHHLEDSATSQLGYRLQGRDLRNWVQDALGLGDRPETGSLLGEVWAVCRGRLPRDQEPGLRQLTDDLRSRGVDFLQELEEFFEAVTEFAQGQGDGKASQYDQRIRLAGAARSQPVWSRVEMAWDNTAAHLHTLGRGLEQLSASLDGLERRDSEEVNDLLLNLASFRRGVQEWSEQMDAVVANPPPDQISWVQVRAAAGDISLHAAPLHVGPLVEQHFFDAKRSVVMTSATLQTSGSFDFMRERLSAGAADELAVGSPFDYERSTLLYIPTDVAEPNTPGYQQAVNQAVLAVAQAAKGRTLVLFTSFSQLNATASAIGRALAQEGITILQQGDGGSRSQLLETFRAGESASVLMGTRSFWEGVDVVGEALSCLVIVRLPFAVPTEPVFAARAEGFDDPFNDYMVPDAILKLRQGFGRLIRSRSDRGVVVILDRRVLTKKYGGEFLASLPACRTAQGTLGQLGPATERWLTAPPAK
ncbi:MAG: DEAD/DEAH box helicase family protein [Chloroflexi bacterium]|nr:DEAD/DEAH box helicase family protein [Chloroflexota bacterium]